MGATTAGVTGGNPVPMTTAARVTPVTEHNYGAVPTTIDSKTGTTIDAWSATIDFDWATREVLVRCVTNNMDIRFSYDGITFTDFIEVVAGVALPLDIQVKSFQVRSHTPGNAAIYDVDGYILY